MLHSPIVNCRIAVSGFALARFVALYLVYTPLVGAEVADEVLEGEELGDAELEEAPGKASTTAAVVELSRQSRVHFLLQTAGSCGLTKDRRPENKSHRAGRIVMLPRVVMLKRIGEYQAFLSFDVRPHATYLCCLYEAINGLVRPHGAISPIFFFKVLIPMRIELRYYYSWCGSELALSIRWLTVCIHLK